MANKKIKVYGPVGREEEIYLGFGELEKITNDNADILEKIPFVINGKIYRGYLTTTKRSGGSLKGIQTEIDYFPPSVSFGLRYKGDRLIDKKAREYLHDLSCSFDRSFSKKSKLFFFLPILSGEPSRRYLEYSFRVGQMGTQELSEAVRTLMGAIPVMREFGEVSKRYIG